MLQRLREEEGGGFALGFVFLAEGIALVLGQRGDELQIFETDPVPQPQRTLPSATLANGSSVARAYSSTSTTSGILSYPASPRISRAPLVP